MNFGLLPTQKDGRDIALGALYILPKLSDLPDEFLLEPLEVKDQGDSDFCAAFASSLISELQEGVELSPEWIFAASQTINKTEWGQDLRSICKTHIKIGAIEKKDAPFNLDTTPYQTLKNFEYWPPELKDKAQVHKKSAYVSIEGNFDEFDNIRSALWHFKNEKRGIIFGVLWKWPTDNPDIDIFSEDGFGHALSVIGWTKRNGELKLIVQNSYGLIGDKGRFYFGRDVINKSVNKFQAFMFIDLPDDHTKETAIERTQWWKATTKEKIKILFQDFILWLRIIFRG